MYYDDNYGAYEIDSEEDIAFYHQTGTLLTPVLRPESPPITREVDCQFPRARGGGGGSRHEK